MFALDEKMNFINEDFKKTTLYTTEIPSDRDELLEYIQKVVKPSFAWVEKFRGKGEAVERYAMRIYRDFVGSVERTVYGKIERGEINADGR